METPIDFTTDHVLENDKVLLRPLRSSDFVNLVKFSTDEPELWKFSLITAAQPDNLKNYLQIAENGRVLQTEYPFIVFDKVRNTYAGSTRFYDIQPSLQTLQLGYTWYGGAHQGTGVNKNCKFLLLQFAFEKWLVERVEFRADNDNARSIAAMKSLGAKVDGILRNNMPKREGGRRNSIVLSILKSEWENGIKESLGSKL